MTLTIQHVYTAYVTIIYFNEDGITFRHNDCGTLDDITERVCEYLVKHNFVSAEVCAEDSGEVLINIERS